MNIYFFNIPGISVVPMKYRNSIIQITVILYYWIIGRANLDLPCHLQRNYAVTAAAMVQSLALERPRAAGTTNPFKKKGKTRKKKKKGQTPLLRIREGWETVVLIIQISIKCHLFWDALPVCSAKPVTLCHITVI